MRNNLSRAALLSAILMFSSQAYADGIRIVSSIAPIHAIVVAVVGERAQADLLLKGSASPHHFSLKPSHARMLQQADFVILVDPGLESFLEKPLRSFNDTQVLRLTDAPGIRLWETRKIGVLEKESITSHSHSHHHGHDHDAHSDDLHLWLDPNNAIAIAEHLVGVLSKADPQGQPVYQTNFEQFQMRLEQISREVEAQLKPYRNQSYVVFHDAFQYFEKRFDLRSPAVLTLNPEMAPSAKVVREIRDYLAHSDARCVYREPQFSPAILDSLAEGLDVMTAELDPLGDSATVNKDYYPQMILAMARAFESCFAQSGR